MPESIEFTFIKYDILPAPFNLEEYSVLETFGLLVFGKIKPSISPSPFKAVSLDNSSKFLIQMHEFKPILLSVFLIKIKYFSI